ncbi:hypothetical protein AMJ74_06600 [candidate division WOR_3 bacterium SM1_77]|uniref:Uncharacterized protein n=1 Tax=candidate division WOR_3 bacterium SM1_77 TaxID=1703778 RepID=A0A0S8JSI7_UNCW3|nr:MAG: hypothetical protein AMJ74_06600 [candidate division WOR_3 bacterium SM1_77]
MLSAFKICVNVKEVLVDNTTQLYWLKGFQGVPKNILLCKEAKMLISKKYASLTALVLLLLPLLVPWSII